LFDRAIKQEDHPRARRFWLVADGGMEKSSVLADELIL
jgi:hypothetical protein